MQESIRCDRCGKTFWSKYYSGGSIEHDNRTNEHNLNVMYNRGTIIKEMNLEEDNYCNVKNITTDTVEEINKCVLLWLKQKDVTIHNKAVEFFEKREKKLEELLNKCDAETKENLLYYWARSNRLLDVLDGHKSVNIQKIATSSGGEKYIAITEKGTILLDLEED